MSDNPVPVESLRAAIRGALLRAQELITLLAEHLDITAAALARGEAADLETYLGHELALLAKLDQTFRQQHELLHRQGLTADRQGLETAIKRCADPQLETLWVTLRSQLEECRERNRSNARLAKQSSLRAKAALQILRGGDAETTGYGPGGDLQSGTARHTIARA